MTYELMRWRESPPDDGSWINLFPVGSENGIYCKATTIGFFHGVEAEGRSRIHPDDDDLWCYAPDPPLWKDFVNKREARKIVNLINQHREAINDLEETGRKLAEIMKEPDR